MRPSPRTDGLWPNPLANATFTRLTDFEGVERDAAISPDGRFVAFLSNRTGRLEIWVTQVGTGTAVNLTQGRTGNLDGLVRALGFSGDGSQVWFHEADVTMPLRTLPLMGGAPRVFLASTPVKTPPWNVAWSPRRWRGQPPPPEPARTARSRLPCAANICDRAWWRRSCRRRPDPPRAAPAPAATAAAGCASRACDRSE